MYKKESTLSVSLSVCNKCGKHVHSNFNFEKMNFLLAVRLWKIWRPRASVMILFTLCDTTAAQWLLVLNQNLCLFGRMTWVQGYASYSDRLSIGKVHISAKERCSLSFLSTLSLEASTGNHTVSSQIFNYTFHFSYACQRVQENFLVPCFHQCVQLIWIWLKYPCCWVFCCQQAVFSFSLFFFSLFNVNIQALAQYPISQWLCKRNPSGTIKWHHKKSSL